MKLLEFVGFSGDKASGLRELEKGALLTETMRGPLCAMALMGFHVMVTFMLGTISIIGCAVGKGGYNLC